MKNEIQLIVNTLFWEKYVDTLTKENYKELVNEFYKALEVMIPSVKFEVKIGNALDTHSTVFVVKNLIVIV